MPDCPSTGSDQCCVDLGPCVGHFAFSRDGCVQWNYIDFIVVVFGYLSFIPGVGKVSAFRAIRVLRPLKTLNKMKGMRVIVMTLLNSMGHLWQAVLLILFLFTVYSIICVQVRHGNGFKTGGIRRCVSVTSGAACPPLLTLCVGCVTVVVSCSRAASGSSASATTARRGRA